MAVYPGNTAYLLSDGHLLRAGKAMGEGLSAGGEGGVVEGFDWDGQLIWSFRYSDSHHRQHHDAIKLPNGNVLMVAWESKSAEEAIAAGRDPRLLTQAALWPDTLIEVKPVGIDSGTIVWEWHAWDHLIQDFDPTRDNFGDVAGNPQLIDLLYRHGNPLAYRAGAGSDQSLFGQHNPSWIPAGRPGAGNLLVFNNGRGRPGGAYSTVEELIAPLASDGSYGLSNGSAADPTETAWIYPAGPDARFYAENVSGAQRLPNGNTLFCQGPAGVISEVTPEGIKVWEYVNPVTTDGVLTQGDAPVPRNLVFRAYRYEPKFPGLSGRDLTPQGTIELNSGEPFRVVEVTRRQGGLLLRWNSQTGRDYEIQYSSDLASNPWYRIGTVGAIGTSTTYLDANPDRLERPLGYYRILQL